MKTLDQRRRFICAGAILFATVGAVHFAAHAESGPRTPQSGASSAAAADAGCEVNQTTHEGWPAVRIANHWAELILVPKLGGRLMQVKFAGHAYLFENPQLKGKYFPPLPPGAKPDWYNYGGDKIWPMPEGREDAQHWPGPIADEDPPFP